MPLQSELVTIVVAGFYILRAVSLLLHLALHLFGSIFICLANHCDRGEFSALNAWVCPSVRIHLHARS